MTQERRSPPGQQLMQENRHSGPGSDRSGELEAVDGQLSFEDAEEMSGRGNNARTGGTWRADGGSSGKLAPPREILSDRNGPSDPVRGPGFQGS